MAGIAPAEQDFAKIGRAHLVIHWNFWNKNKL
jgi:hypothetical protein